MFFLIPTENIEVSQYNGSFLRTKFESHQTIRSDKVHPNAAFSNIFFFIVFVFLLVENSLTAACSPNTQIYFHILNLSPIPSPPAS